MCHLQRTSVGATRLAAATVAIAGGMFTHVLRRCKTSRWVYSRQAVKNLELFTFNRIRSV